MLTTAYYCLAGAICRRFKGGGVYGGEEFDKEGNKIEDPLKVFRRYGSPLIFLLLILLISKSWLVAIVSAIGFAAIDMVGTGDMFAVVHGGYDGDRKYSIWNKWVYKLSDKLIGLPYILEMTPALNTYASKRNAKWGFVFCTLRGSYKLVTSILLALVTLNPTVALWGLLGFLDGGIYFIAGRIGYYTKQKSVSIAELTSGGVLGEIINESVN